MQNIVVVVFFYTFFFSFFLFIIIFFFCRMVLFSHVPVVELVEKGIPSMTVYEVNL